MKPLTIGIIFIAIIIIFFIYVNFTSAAFEEPAPYNNPTTTSGNIDSSESAFPEYDYGGWWWDYPWWWSSYPLYEYNYYPYIWGDRYYHGDTHWDHPRGGHPRPRPPPPPPPPGGSHMGGSMPRGGGMPRGGVSPMGGGMPRGGGGGPRR